MIKFFPSDLKFEFANIFLNKIFNFNENDDKYRFFPIRNGIPTDATSSLIDTEKILKHLNCYLECYFFTAMSSLDALAYEIFDKFNLEKLIKIYITTFDPEKAEKNTKIKKILLFLTGHSGRCFFRQILPVRSFQRAFSILTIQSRRRTRSSVIENFKTFC